MARYFPPWLREAWIQCEGAGPHRVADPGGYPYLWMKAGEPSLAEASQSRGAKQVRSYRLTWLRTFHAPMIVRVEQPADGQMTVIAKRLSGRAGYYPGLVDATMQRPLTRDEQVRFNQALTAANHLNLAPADCRLGVDGSQWVFEANDQGTYRYVKRWTPEAGAVREFGEVLLGFTGWKLGPVY